MLIGGTQATGEIKTAGPRRVTRVWAGWTMCGVLEAGVPPTASDDSSRSPTAASGKRHLSRRAWRLRVTDEVWARERCACELRRIRAFAATFGAFRFPAFAIARAPSTVIFAQRNVLALVY